MAATANQQPVAASEGERQSLERLDAMFQHSDATQSIKLAGQDGEEVVLPLSMVGVLRQVVHYLAANKDVTVVPVNTTLTTQAAADILNISRPYLIRLLEEGAMPFTKVGTHRRIQLDDVLAYKRRRDSERNHALDRLAALNQ